MLAGCAPPPLPPEVKLTEDMEHDLWKVQAQIFAAEQYRSFQTTIKSIREDLVREEARFVWFRDYEPIAQRLRAALKEGGEILRKVQERRETKRLEIIGELSELQERMSKLERLSLAINEGRLLRSTLTKADLMIKEAGLLLNREDYEGAASRLVVASDRIQASEKILAPILGRYTDKALIEKWRRWVEAVAAESREQGIAAIVVTKIDKRLIVYQRGKPFRTYQIGIGRNGLSDKLLAGDGATPEGRYRVVQKRLRSRFHKALLLNYPNDEDRRQFLNLKKMGLIPKRAGMGGLIEIHGGGKDGMTYGCVSLENRDIDEVFEFVPLGTPVAIVGKIFQKDD